MIHEIQGSVGDIAGSITAINRRSEIDSSRLTSLETISRNVIDRLDALAPKIDSLGGFVSHGVPHLATKADLEALRSAISERPTRRQAIEDLLKFGGLIAVLVALLGFLSKAH